MRPILGFLVAVGLISLLTYAAPQTQSLAGLALKSDPEQALKAYRSDLQAERADIMSKNITLTPEQAAKFWPAYTKFQAEQAVIVDDQMKSVQKYVDAYSEMDDSTALTLVNANLSRDSQMVALRNKWLGEFRKILPTRTAARVIQIDRRLGLTSQLALSAQLPLIY